MSLKAFHVVFIVISILIAGGFAAWCFLSPEGGPYRALGTVSALAAPALAAYLAWFLKKSGRLGSAS